MYTMLVPRLRVNSLAELDVIQLKQEGIKGIIFDVDNTIVPWDSPTMQQEITDWLNDIIAMGFKVSLVSNNWHRRVRDIALLFDIPFVARAYKPAKRGFRRALAAMGLLPGEVAVVGDQLLTDVLGGNRLGLYTIWVRPLTEHEFIGTRIHRKFEKLVVRILRAKGLMP